MRFSVFVPPAVSFFIGIAFGDYLFSKSLPRSYLDSAGCGDNCYDQNQLNGLIASLGILRTAGLIPGVVAESDTCIAIRYPRPEKNTHYVLFPKRDVKNIASITPADSPFVLGCLAMVRTLVVEGRIKDYYVETNGPARQEIAFLHFHLFAVDDESVGNVGSYPPR